MRNGGIALIPAVNGLMSMIRTVLSRSSGAVNRTDR
jgi:hypothetical protein